MPYADPEVKKAKQAEYRAKNRQRFTDAETKRNADLKARDPEAFLAKHREWRSIRKAEGRENMERGRAAARARHARLKDDPEFRRKAVIRAVEWVRNNPEKVKANLHRRLGQRLRGRLNKAVKRSGKGSASAVRDLGMSIPEFKDYLADKFLPGMTWENYGLWHIDHIRPLSLFDLTDDEQIRAAIHYSNMQPLWGPDNIRKSSKYSP